MWMNALDADTRYSIREVSNVREVSVHEGIRFKVVGSIGGKGCRLI